MSQSLDSILVEARDRCEGDAAVYNLLLYAHLDIDDVEAPFGGGYLEEARTWQAPKRPPELHINHGEYVHAAGDGIEYIINQLRDKPDGNRALYSLINMEDVVPSGDRPIPSFLILQFGKLERTLYCTAYFRALEVSEFLPVNLTEICLVVQQIRAALSDLQSVELCIHAFRAYSKPGFDRLRRAELDLQPSGIVAVRVTNRDKETIKRWLSSKLLESSVIETRGVEELHNALQDMRHTDDYAEAFVRGIADAKACLETLRDQRTRSTFGRQIEKLNEQFKTHIRDALKAL